PLHPPFSQSSKYVRNRGNDNFTEPKPKYTGHMEKKQRMVKVWNDLQPRGRTPRDVSGKKRDQTGFDGPQHARAPTCIGGVAGAYFGRPVKPLDLSKGGHREPKQRHDEGPSSTVPRVEIMP